MRLRPVFVAVSTWVLTWLVALALAAFPSISGGAQGLVLDTGLPAVWHYELALLLLAAAVLGYTALARAPFGVRLFAAAQRPAAATALGVPIGRMRLRDYGKQTEAHAMKGRAHELIRPGGLGLHLIRTAFDRVDYILKARGTELVMTKNLEKAA